jgi:hypothetical protein
MTTSEAVRLQKRWKLLKFQMKCQHRVQVVERSDKGYLTGKYVCTACGEVMMPTISSTEGHESKRRLSKALAQHPLILLDQQLQRAVNNDNLATRRQVLGLKKIYAGMRFLSSR